MKVDDLLDLLTDKAARGGRASATRSSRPTSARRVGAQIAVAAIRYFMLKFSRGKLIVFDIEEALSFEGETGPYLQYAVVRANNIFQKLQEREGVSEADVLAGARRPPADELTAESDDAAHDLWALVLEASRLDEVVEQVVRSLEFSGAGEVRLRPRAAVQRVLPPVPDPQRGTAPTRKRWRAAGVAYFRAQLTRALDLMGIDSSVPDVATMAADHGRHRHHAVPQARRLPAVGPARRRRACAILDPSTTRRRTRSTASTACC